MTPSLLLIGYLMVINATAFFVMGGDKFSAAGDFSKRTPEGVLFFLAVIGGTVGVFGGMFLFRHKTRKWYFLLGFPILLLQQIFIFNLIFDHSPFLSL